MEDEFERFGRPDWFTAQPPRDSPMQALLGPRAVAKSSNGCLSEEIVGWTNPAVKLM
jgi:hypothetical protein